MDNIYIHKMPFRQRQELVDILNSGDAWRDLGGYYMNYSTVDLDKFAMQVHKPGGSPADAMLSTWGQRNHTVLQLWNLLLKMRHYQAMEAIKSLVPESVRHELTPPTSSTAVNAVQYSGINRAHHPPPPINQAQAIQMMQDNLNINVEKGYPSHLSMPARSLNPVPSDHPEPLNPSQWDPTGKNINPNVAGSTQALNIPVATSTQRNPTGATNVPPTTSLNNTPKSTLGTSMPATGGSILKQRNPSGIHIQDTNLFFANVPFEELKKCCNNFNNKIGQGGFGAVYKGRRNCNDIAVKRIRGDKRMNKESYLRIINQFIVELQSMHTFPAENILLLLAYSFTEDLSTEPCLVYQYMPNGSVSDRLKCTGGSAALTWDQRKNIAFQTAKGLCHLHGNKIVHGDIKSGNILLDSNFKAHIGDFGLARGGPEADQDHKTVSVIIGTDWYLPDDYRRSFDLKYAVDTFCYGMFLFDLVTGKSPSAKDPTTNKYMRDVMLKKDPQEPIVEHVDQNVGYDLWAKFLYCFGKDCTNPIANKRPKMGSVNDALEQLIKGQPQALAMQKFYDEKNKKLDSGPPDLMRHEDVKTPSTRKLLPSGKVAGNDNGIPVIPSIINSVPSASGVASGVPSVVAAGVAVPDIVFGFNPGNNESSCNVVSGEYSEDFTSDSEYTESAMSEMSRDASQWDPELRSASIAVIQEYTNLKSGN